MIRRALAVFAVVAVPFTALAEAPPAAAPWPPPMPTPGAEQKALERLVGTLVYEGTITPPASSGKKPSAVKSTHTCKKVAGDMWIACDDENEPADPTFPKFKAHETIGYDIFTKEYRILTATAQGVSLVEHGKLEGNKLVLMSDEVTTPSNHKIKSRVTIDLSDPKKVRVTDERSTDGGPFATFGDMTSK